MTLLDQIMDEAEKIAQYHILRPDPTAKEIVSAVSESLQIHLQPNSVGAKCATASYFRASTEVNGR